MGEVGACWQWSGLQCFLPRAHGIPEGEFRQLMAGELEGG